MGCLFLGCGGNAGAHPTVPGAAICGGRRNQHFLVRRQVEVAGTFTTFTLFFFFSQCFSETVPVCPFFGWAVVAATLAHLSLPTASPVHPCALCKFSF